MIVNKTRRLSSAGLLFLQYEHKRGNKSLANANG